MLPSQQLFLGHDIKFGTKGSLPVLQQVNNMSCSCLTDNDETIHATLNLVLPEVEQPLKKLPK